mmetsp:Transcript_8177/g.28244  ORF Transcript_8177/g.28244 Transcript_8177/m.28244 type:complete len:313 (+) Transcript_8177:48-986(+)
MIRPLQGSASKVVYDRAQSDANFLRRECNRLDAENAALRRALETARCEATAAHATAQLCARVACDGDGLSRSLGPSSTRLEITAFGDAVVESEAALQLAERRRKRLVKQRNDDRATAAAAFAAAGKLADARQAKLLRDGAAAAAAAAVAFAAVSAEVRRLRPGGRVADDAQRLAGARAQCEALRLKAKVWTRLCCSRTMPWTPWRRSSQTCAPPPTRTAPAALKQRTPAARRSPTAARNPQRETPRTARAARATTRLAAARLAAAATRFSSLAATRHAAAATARPAATRLATAATGRLAATRLAAATGHPRA